MANKKDLYDYINRKQNKKIEVIEKKYEQLRKNRINACKLKIKEIINKINDYIPDSVLINGNKFLLNKENLFDSRYVSNDFYRKIGIPSITTFDYKKFFEKDKNIYDQYIIKEEQEVLNYRNKCDELRNKVALFGINDELIELLEELWKK